MSTISGKRQEIREMKSPCMAVECPTCGAKAGGWCKRPSGHSGPMVAFHAARRKAAEAAEATYNRGDSADDD
ncbi:MAG TPA: hypothetical protein PK205_16445 [Promineifilum sp.]|nr:hypothetical protein [Promineifilum sp.]